MRIPFAQIDAFADRPFTGNPAAVMPLSAWLDDDVLQAIAAENNLSETAFIIPTDDDEAEFDLRWFTPTAEVALCGHATLASGHFVLTSDPSLVRVRFRTRRSGVLEVARVDGAYELALPALAPSPAPLPEVIAALGLTDVRETLWHANRYGVIVVEDEAVVRGLNPDFAALARHGDALSIITAPGRDTDIVSRVFAGGVGIDEDPVTGGAHAVLVPYWASRLGRDRFSAYQASARGGRLACRLNPAPAEAGGDRVVLGGNCVTLIEGIFLLP